MARKLNYDLTIDHDATSFGLMIDWKAQNAYRDFMASVLNPNLSPESVEYAAYPTDKDWPIAQKTWNAGFGKLVHDAKHDDRYGESVGWDLRVEGEARAFSSETAVTITPKTALAGAEFSNLDMETWSDATTLGTWTKVGSPTTNRSTTKQGGTYSCNLVPVLNGITDGGFEAWDDSTTLTNWTETAASITQEGTIKNAGTYSCRLDNSTAAEIYQDMSWDTSYQGVSVTYTAYGYGNTTGTGVRIGLDDGVGTTWSSYQVPAAWAQLSVVRTLDGSATRLRIIVQRINEGNGPVYIDGPSTLTELATGDVSLYQDMTSWDTYYNNKQATLTAYVKTSLTNNLRVGITDGVDTTYSSYDSGDNNWNQLTVNHTCNPASTKIRLLIERNSFDYDATDYIDTLAFSQAAASRGTPMIRSFLTWATDYYYLENKTIYKYDTDAYKELYTTEDVIVAAKVYKNRLLLTVGTGDFYYYCDAGDDSVWTRSSVTEHKIGYVDEVSGTAWGAVADAKVASATDITADPGWTTGSSIGDSSITITNLIEYNGTMYVCKEDNIYTMTIASDLTYTSAPIAPRFKGISSTGNFKQAAVGDTLMLLHTKGVHSWEYTDFGAFENISPVLYGPSFTDYHGAGTAIAVDEDWTYIVVDPVSGNTKSKVMAVRRGYITGAEKPVDWRWHTLAEVDQDECYGADVHSNKLWISGTKSSTASVKSFALDGSDYPDNNALGVKVEFQIDSATSWTELNGSGTGEFTSAGTIAFQDNQNGKRIRFRLTLKNVSTAYFITSYFDGGLSSEVKSFRTFTLEGDTLNADGVAATPVIKGIVLRSVLRTPPLRTIHCTVMCMDDTQTKTGVVTIPATTLKSQINALASEADPVTLYDIHGSAMTCSVVPPTPHEFDIKQVLPTDKVESKIELVFQEVKTG